MAELNRETERARYGEIYRRHKDYICKGGRLPAAQADIIAIPSRGSYLDVGCGTRQMLTWVWGLGFDPVIGLDHAAAGADVIAQAHALPFKDRSFDVVVMLDVLEHLVPGDEVLALMQLRRVAKKHILVSANNTPSVWDGFDLHINKKPYEAWLKLFQMCLGGKINPMPGHHSSPTWRIDL